MLSFPMQAGIHVWFVIQHRQNTRALAKGLSPVSEHKGKAVVQQEHICHRKYSKVQFNPIKSSLNTFLQSSSWLPVSENTQGTLGNVLVGNKSEIAMLWKLILSHQNTFSKRFESKFPMKGLSIIRPISSQTRVIPIFLILDLSDCWSSPPLS